MIGLSRLKPERQHLFQPESCVGHYFLENFKIMSASLKPFERRLDVGGPMSTAVSVGLYRVYLLSRGAELKNVTSKCNNKHQRFQVSYVYPWYEHNVLNSYQENNKKIENQAKKVSMNTRTVQYIQ